MALFRCWLFNVFKSPDYFEDVKIITPRIINSKYFTIDY